MKLSALAAFALYSMTTLVFAGTDISHTRYRDETARAEYSWVEGCTSKQLVVTASRTKLREDGVTADNVPSVSITFSTFTFCDLSNPESTFWFGTAPGATLDIDSNLRAARLAAGSASLQGYSFKGGQQTDLGTRTVSVGISWSSDDPLDKYAGTIVTQYPGYQEVNHLTGLYRLATASGTVWDGVSNWFPSAPESGFVQLYRLNQAETILIKD